MLLGLLSSYYFVQHLYMWDDVATLGLEIHSQPFLSGAASTDVPRGASLRLV